MPEAGVHGTVLLMDEVETLFTARGKALLRILAAMRVLLDLPTGVPGGVPLLGVFAAVPDILEQLTKYPALEQRLAVRGATFEEGNDLAIELRLEKVEGQQILLAGIGQKLIEVGRLATGHEFDKELQSGNACRLAKVASQRSLEIDARRVYVKTWVNILNIQASDAEREFSEEELAQRYQGNFDTLRDADQDGFEP